MSKESRELDAQIPWCMVCERRWSHCRCTVDVANDPPGRERCVSMRLLVEPEVRKALDQLQEGEAQLALGTLSELLDPPEPDGEQRVARIHSDRVRGQSV